MNVPDLRLFVHDDLKTRRLKSYSTKRIKKLEEVNEKLRDEVNRLNNIIDDREYGLPEGDI